MQIWQCQLQGESLKFCCKNESLYILFPCSFPSYLHSLFNGRNCLLFFVSVRNAEPKTEMEENARQLLVQCTKNLVLDCKTRWNSTYLMLSTTLIYKDVFLRLAKRETSYTCLPHGYDWKVEKDICGRLELFHSVTSFSLVISTPQLICILLWCVSWKLHWMNEVCLQVRW